ncbi:hypothetical protein BamIOP4010DRAFT_1325 [Burkholderia ambifaria IOP40-10]|uniref:Uncharacterized protein n=1 Tax=Burkholderia ambifaria IOP40-10 TaxID=396596 RepID=B1FBB6_9BURK|nr:hypothetical protein [Burkholderia ambifaria]EDT05198.1 hypothetical protein BamIOP4010DRAFT_1325 [Burkholderia ambifaria IOP40-10]
MRANSRSVRVKFLQPTGNQDIVRIASPQAARIARAAVAELTRSQALHRPSGIPSALQKVSPRGAANLSCRPPLGLGPPQTLPPRYPNAPATRDDQYSAPDQGIPTSRHALTNVDRRIDHDAPTAPGVHDHPGRISTRAPRSNSLTLPPVSNRVVLLRAARDYLNNRPRILGHLMWISNALARMSRQEGLPCKLSDSTPLLNPVTDAARALDTRLTEKIGRETRQLAIVQRKLSLAHTNQKIVHGKAGNFVLQEDHVILAARPCWIVHWQKMITSSAYRERNRKTKALFGTTNSAPIECVLNEHITRLTEESRSIQAQWCGDMESRKTVRSWLQDLRKIKQQISRMGLPRATSIDHRASI